MAVILYLLLLCTIVVAQYQVERTWLRTTEDKSHEKRFDSRNVHPENKAPAPSHRTVRRSRRNADASMNAAMGDEVQRHFKWLTQQPDANDRTSEPPRPTKRPERNVSRPDIDRLPHPNGNESRPEGGRPSLRPELNHTRPDLRKGSPIAKNVTVDDESDASDDEDLDIVISVRVGRGRRRAQTNGGHRVAGTVNPRLPAHEKESLSQ